MRTHLRISVGVALLAAPLSAQSASFVTSGAGCPTPGSPSLSIDQPPVIGSTPTVTCDNLPLDTVLAAMLVGGSPVTVNLGPLLGAPGCDLYVGGVFASPTMALAPPAATFALPIPHATSLVGTVLEMQTLGISVASGWVASDRGTMTVGDGVPVLLRDASCAPSTGCTNNGSVITAYQLSASSYDSSPMRLTAVSPLVMTSFRGIGNSLGTINWSSITWKVDVWIAGASSTVEQEFLATPLSGNFVSSIALAESHVSLPNGDFLVSLAAPVPIAIPAGSYLVMVSAYGTSWFWRETSMLLPSDIITNHNYPAQWFTYSLLPGYATGAQAVDIFGW